MNLRSAAGLLFFLGGMAPQAGTAGLSTSKTAYFGPTSLSNEVHPQLFVNGPATLVNVTVTRETSIKGPADLTNSRFQHLSVYGRLRGINLSAESLEVYGPTTLSQTTIRGSATVMGPLIIDGGDYGDLQVAADTVTLKDATIKSLKLKENHPDHPHSQTVTLEGTAHVEGDIVFEKEGGIVRVKGKEVTIQGDIKRGTRHDEAS